MTVSCGGSVGAGSVGGAGVVEGPPNPGLPFRLILGPGLNGRGPPTFSLGLLTIQQIYLVD